MKRAVTLVGTEDRDSFQKGASLRVSSVVTAAGR